MKNRLATNLSVFAVFLYAYAVPVNFLVFREGVSGLIYLLAIIPFFYFDKISWFKKEWWRYEEWGLGLLVAWMALSLILQAVFVSDFVDRDGASVRAGVFVLFSVNMLWLISGASVSSFNMGRNNYLAVLMLLVLLLVVVPNLNEAFLISYVDLIDAGAGGASHLMVGEMFLFVCFFAYSIAGPYVRPFCIAVTAFLLFSAGGRSSLYFGVGALVFSEIFISGVVGRVSVFVAVLVVVLATYFSGLDMSDSFVQRMLFSDGVGVDASYAERDEYLSVGLRLLPQQALFGDPVLLVRENGVAGSYIHNALSMWQFFGFIPFLLFLILLFLLGRKIVGCLGRDRSPLSVFGGLCFMYAVIGVIFSKSIGFPALWFSIGFWTFRSALKEKI